MILYKVGQSGESFWGHAPRALGQRGHTGIRVYQLGHPKVSHFANQQYILLLERYNFYALDKGASSISTRVEDVERLSSVVVQGVVLWAQKNPPFVH